MIPAVVARAAGIDVGKKFVVVCVQTGSLDQEPVRETRQYGTTVAALEQLAQWLRETPVTHVVMESTGVDMRRFATEGHLASWAGLCPGNRESAGKQKSGATTKGNRWLRATLSQCAWAASR